MSGATAEQLEELAAPFDPEQIRWRVLGKPKSEKKPQCMALAYIDARDVMNRLDKVVGRVNWQDDYTQGPTGTVFCELALRVQLSPAFTSDTQGVFPAVDEWLTKSDGAGQTDIEADKGAISGALKRAAVKWGVGRYLYDLPSPWVAVEQRGRSWTIKASEKPRLAQILTALTAGEPVDVGDHGQSPPADADRLAQMIGWCEANSVTRAMVFQYLERDDAGWITISAAELHAVSLQAKLVQGGDLAPDEAFGHSEGAKAEELTTRISGAGPAQPESFDAPPGDKSDADD